MNINFWYARGSWIQSLIKPLKTNDRFYYEIWLSQRIKDMPFDKKTNFDFVKNCYQFFTDKKTFANIGSYFHQQRYFNLDKI
jgi:hypothetical protein